MRLKRSFFDRNTVLVAKELLGKYLVRRVSRKIVKAKIIETEAYCGPEDKASHASKGVTPRTKVMFGPAGFTYVYLIYGMYHCLNIVTEREGYPAAVLIRTVEIQNPKSPAGDLGSPLRDSKFKNQNNNEKLRGNLVALRNLKLKNPLLNGPGILCRELNIDRTLNNIDITTSKDIWIEDSKNPTKPNQIKMSKRIGVDYAGEWKDKLWRFYLWTSHYEIALRNRKN